MFIAESERVLGKLEFARQGGGEQCRVVRIEGDHDALIEVVFRGMLGDGATHSGAKVAGNAELDRNLALGKFFDQVRILRGSEGVTDSLSAQVERSPDGFRRTGLSGVSRKP